MNHQPMIRRKPTTPVKNPHTRRFASTASSRSLLELVSAEAHLEVQRDLAGEGDLIPAGELVVRTERRADDLILWLGGELDRATSTLFEHEIEAALGRPAARRVVDLSGLEFIDSAGLRALALAQQRAGERGGGLSVEGPQIVRSLLELTNRERLDGEPASSDEEHYYFALALAGADVDHQRSHV